MYAAQNSLKISNDVQRFNYQMLLVQYRLKLERQDEKKDCIRLEKFEKNSDRVKLTYNLKFRGEGPIKHLR